MNKEVPVDPKLEANAIKILDLIAEGLDEQAVCTRLRIKRGTLIKWMIAYPEFESAMKTAKEMRADTYKSKIVESLYDKEGKLVKLDKDEVPGEKLNFEKLKWLAEIDNPDKYGSKIKHEGNVTMPVQIVVDTGIDNQKPDVIVQETSETDLL